MEHIVKKLDLITELKNDTTIDIKSLSIVQHNSWSSSASRYAFGESRYLTMIFIAATIFESINIIDSNHDNPSACLLYTSPSPRDRS